MGLLGLGFKTATKASSKFFAKQSVKKVVGTSAVVGGTAALVAGSSAVTTAIAKPTYSYEYNISNTPTNVAGDVYGGVKADATTNKTNNDPLSNILSSGAGSGSEGGGIGSYIPIIAIAGLGLAGLYVYTQKKR